MTTIVLVLVVGGAWATWSATRPLGPSYRTAQAGPAAVTDALAATGTIEPVSEATVSFPISGQVASVDVHQGQQVSAGQTLAQLATTSLSAQVSSGQAALASAQARLAADQASQTEAVSGAAAGSSTSQPARSSGSGSAGGSGQVSAGLSGGQAAVKAAQAKVDTDLTLVDAAVQQENRTCPPVIQSLSTVKSTTGNPAPPPPSSASSTQSSSSSASSPPSAPAQNSASQPAEQQRSTDAAPTNSTVGASNSNGPSAQAATDCTALLQQVLDGQHRTSADEQALAGAEAALTAALSKANAAVQQAAQATGASTARSSAAGGGSSDHGSGSTGHGGAPASADQLAADQSAVDSATAQVAAAQQGLAAATLVSPLSGTVAQVGITAGQTASANSNTAAVVIIGPGTSEVTTAIDDSQVGRVKPGQAASVVPDGGSIPITGTVTAIGALGSATSSGTASYPVTISLDPSSQPLFAGADASVSITLGTAEAAVTVPTSAVHTIGANKFVNVLRNGTPTLARVNLGVVGGTVAEVTSGLNAGEQVVLADLSQPLPSGNTNIRGLTGGGGNFRGGGGGAGGGGTRRG